MRTKHPQAQVKSEYDGSSKSMISSGSTLLDLAISGGRKRGGGIPGGILVEIFGPPSSGKTVLLCEIAGAIQRQGGQVLLFDPEARLNERYAKLFGLDTEAIEYSNPDTIPQVFRPIRARNWPTEHINGVVADSLAALSTEMELDDKDQYGMRRAKEFSEELRKTCRILAKENILMVCSNQVRDNVGASQWEPRHRSTGGQAVSFYSSLRLRCGGSSKIKDEKKIAGKVVQRTVGIETVVEVFKSSVWKPYHNAPLTILFDYGIDDIRENLKFVKQYTGSSKYAIDGEVIDVSLDRSCQYVENNQLESNLRNQVIDLWTQIESEFTLERKPRYGG